MLQTLLDSCAALGVPLTAAQAEQLCEFGARLLEQNRVMNLTAITEPQAVAKLHFADCLRAAAHRAVSRQARHRRRLRGGLPPACR
ncbi:MAG: hypothetical protein ACLTCV_06060 [Oscillospiraceae bacterium]